MRPARPWYWERRDGWYVTEHGQRHFLGAHPNDAPAPRKSPKTGQWNVPRPILDAFHRLMKGERQLADGDAVVNVLDDFLAWCYENRAARTGDRYKDFLDDFVKSCGTLPVSDLTGKHVTQWLAERPTWNSTTKRNAITALQRGFNWAVKNRGLKYNPIKGMEKPEAKRRKSLITAEEFEQLLTVVPDEPFRDLLVLTYDSGARPFEVKELEARHVQLEMERAVIPADEAKGRRHTRAIYFPTARSLEIVRRLVRERPEGKLLLNNRGNPWTGMAVKIRFANLEEKVGKRFKHYDMRRSFITDKIIAGVDSHVVAKLAGHQSTAMIDKHYSQVADDHAFMLNAAKTTNRATGNGVSSGAASGP